MSVASYLWSNGGALFLLIYDSVGSFSDLQIQLEAPLSESFEDASLFAQLLLPNCVSAEAFKPLGHVAPCQVLSGVARFTHPQVYDTYVFVYNVGRYLERKEFCWNTSRFEACRAQSSLKTLQILMRCRWMTVKSSSLQGRKRVR